MTNKALKSGSLWFCIFVLASMLAPSVGRCAASDQSDVSGQFEQKFQAWLDARAAWIKAHEKDDLSFLPVLAEAQAVLDMGPAVAPLLIEKMKTDLTAGKWDDSLCSSVTSLFRMLTERRFSESERSSGPWTNRAEMAEYVKWSKEGRKKLSQLFDARYEKWDGLEKAGKAQEATVALEDIRDLGKEILPLVIQKIRAGDDRLIPMVARIVKEPKANAVPANDAGKLVGANDAKPTAGDVLAWWRANESKYKFPDSALGEQATAQFNTRFDAWLIARAEWIKAHEKEDPLFLPELPEERAVLDMGPSVVPLIIEKMDLELTRQEWGAWLGANVRCLVIKLTERRFSKYECPSEGFTNKSHMAAYVKWWKADRQKTPETFASLYANWSKLVVEGRTDASKLVFYNMSDLGYAALPLVIEKIKNGDERLIPLVKRIVGKPLTVSESTNNVGSDTKPTAESILAWWKANESKYKFPD